MKGLRPILRFFTVGMLAASAMLALLPREGAAQERVEYYDYMRPELEWWTIETEHFLIHFHADTTGMSSGRSAEVIARIAEDIYGPVTSLYQHEPDSKVSIVVKNFEDYSNGAAYFFDNKIDIWAPALSSSLRGEESWLRNVITHEFTHIVQVQKTMRGSRKWPFFYLQWLAYEDVRRPDVLYGYPDVIVSYPIPILNNPAWFAEGTAQFQRADLHYDRWDTHRDMLLRSRFLGGKDLSIAEMGDLLSKTSIQREQVYNQGFAFTTYLANEYGEESLREISDHLGNWLNFTIQSAMTDALGEPGSRVFERWANLVREGYTEATEEIRANQVSGRLVESGGNFNFSPRFSPDGKRVAYASSKGGDYRTTSLYVVDLETNEDVSFRIDGVAAPGSPDMMSCALGESLVGVVTGSIDWSPDGKRIVYAKTNDTDLGYLFADLYEVDVETGKTTRVTHNARSLAPTYSPDGSRIAYVEQSDGSTNLAIVSLDEPQNPTTLTHFDDGTQVYSPRWRPDGRGIVFATGPVHGGRDIYEIGADGSGLRPLLTTTSDERDPQLSHDGRWLYFSSDRTGIFNLNRIPLDRIHGEAATGLSVVDGMQQLTNVVGGAFSPDVRNDGEIIYSLFGADGYKIALLEDPAEVPSMPYKVPDVLHKQPRVPQPDAAVASLNRFDDSDLKGWPPMELDEMSAHPDSVQSAVSSVSEDEVGPSKYSDTFTAFEFFPVLRFDMYADAKRAGINAPPGAEFQGGELLRNTKVGLYMASREVLDGLSMTAGLLVGPWSKSWDSFGEFVSPSRFDKLERDVFLRFDYRKGLPFFKKRWAPQLSVEFYNVVRNVENGLSIEEFPCTACYPDTSYANISYSLWELDLMSRSKLSRNALLEIGYRYSPYRARTETFFSDEQGTSIPSSSTRYFIGHTLLAKLYLEARKPHLNADIIPFGYRAEFGYEFQPSQLLDSYSVEDGLLVPEYNRFKNHRLLADVRLGFKLPFGSHQAPHGLGVRVRGSTILGGPVDSFFNDYVGGLTGARGYPFYALGGNETLLMQLSYEFPILPHIARQLLFLHLNKLYGRVYGDAANAWTTGTPGIDDVRTDLGAELRLGISSFYLLPTAAFLSATYGLNEFVVQLDEGFVTPDGNPFVSYGRQLLWHFGVLFDFDL